MLVRQILERAVQAAWIIGYSRLLMKTAKHLLDNAKITYFVILRFFLYGQPFIKLSVRVSADGV